MPATVIVGAQWGDEGKGKIVDLLAQDSDLVCRYQGGPNAGHTIVVDGETYKIRHDPVRDPVRGQDSASSERAASSTRGVLVEEIDDLEARGISTEGLRLSGNAHLIMPWHVAIDWRQRAAPRPAADRDDAARHRAGVRGQGGAARHPRPGRPRPEDPAPEDRDSRWRRRTVWPRARRSRSSDLADSDCEECAQRLRPYVADTSLLVDAGLASGREGAASRAPRGTLLDLDHGTYPFVTSSNPVAGAAATGIGIGPTQDRRVISASPRPT